jgi:hypothetical protein
MDEKDKPKQIHEDLEGFDVKVNRFGQIESNFDIDKVNEFLNRETDDKKIKSKKEESPDSEEESE